EQQAERDARDRRLAERRAEERHAPRHDQMAYTAEDRREHEHAQKSPHEKRVLKIARQTAALGQAADPCVERRHARAARRPGTAGSSSRTLDVASTSADP